MSDKPEIRVTDADGFAYNEDNAFVILEIQRSDVEAKNIASALERLLVLTDSRENTLRYRDSLALVFAGYDDDPRPLPEIPEVRQFMALLNREWPHWLWFSTRFAGTIPLLLSLLCDVRIIGDSTGTQFGTEFQDQEQIFRVLKDMFGRGNALFDAFGISQKEVKESTESALREIGL